MYTFFEGNIHANRKKQTLFSSEQCSSLHTDLFSHSLFYLSSFSFIPCSVPSGTGPEQLSSADSSWAWHICILPRPSPHRHTPSTLHAPPRLNFFPLFVWIKTLKCAQMLTLMCKRLDTWTQTKEMNPSSQQGGGGDLVETTAYFFSEMGGRYLRGN